MTMTMITGENFTKSEHHSRASGFEAVREFNDTIYFFLADLEQRMNHGPANANKI